MSPVLVPVAEIEVILGESVDVGITRDGHRRVTPILGGTVRGLPSAEDSVVEALRAEIRPGGGDRQLIRGSGDGLVVEIDATYDARTAEGALIGIRAQGVPVAGSRLSNVASPSSNRPSIYCWKRSMVVLRQRRASHLR